MLSPAEQSRFEQLVLPHLDAAFNLARWMVRGRTDAEDLAQEAMVRAYRFFPGFQGGDPRAWLLQIVRNACYSWLDKNRRDESMSEFDEEVHGTRAPTPEALAMLGEEQTHLRDALESLPARFREVIVLRELEGCSYKEIAAIISVPIGTVMSSLARARRQLQIALLNRAGKEGAREL